jgi:hypothetical protein
MTLAVAHREGEIGILDCIREIRPGRGFNPEAIVAEFADLLKSYRITRITGNRYALQWVQEPFRMYGIAYQPADPKDTLYINLLPLLNSRRVKLLDNKRLVSQLLSLERNTTRSGKDSIYTSGHDDVINSCAGALVQCLVSKSKPWHGVALPMNGRHAWSDEPKQPVKIRVVEVAEADMKREGLRAAAPSESFFKPIKKASRW